MNAGENREQDTNEADEVISGIEVSEVDFSEFDRRQKASEAKSAVKRERRGFVGQVDSLIHELHINTARAYSNKHRKK
ncbi:MAG TPA: hypothetical protein VK974_05765 [Methylophilaceae bacterium]|nr:hypothetical protein [Methylophilaceae bacterium]